MKTKTNKKKKSKQKAKLNPRERGFITAFKSMQRAVHLTALQKGWWDGSHNKAQSIALMHTELSEALEYMRQDNPPDDKIPAFDGVSAELADCVIRIMDFAEAHNLPVAKALVAKARYNQGREHKHGGKLF